MFHHGKKRIIMLFKIDKVGNIVDIKAKAPHPRLQKEAIRIIKLLPKMKPGRQRGKAEIYRRPGARTRWPGRTRLLRIHPKNRPTPRHEIASGSMVVQAQTTPRWHDP